MLLPLLFAAPAFAQTEAECKNRVETIINSQTLPDGYASWSRIFSTRACGILMMYDRKEGEKYIGVTTGITKKAFGRKPMIEYSTIYVMYFRKEEKGVE